MCKMHENISNLHEIQLKIIFHIMVFCYCCCHTGNCMYVIVIPEVSNIKYNFSLFAFQTHSQIEWKQCVKKKNILRETGWYGFVHDDFLYFPLRIYSFLFHIFTISKALSFTKRIYFKFAGLLSRIYVCHQNSFNRRLFFSWVCAEKFTSVNELEFQFRFHFPFFFLSDLPHRFQ